MMMMMMIVMMMIGDNDDANDDDDDDVEKDGRSMNRNGSLSAKFAVPIESRRHRVPRAIGRVCVYLNEPRYGTACLPLHNICRHSRECACA